MSQPRTVFGPALVRGSLAVAAVAYVGYLSLLITCDLRRVAPLGFAPRFGANGATIAVVQPGSIGSLAGLQPGDRITRASGQILQRRMDWQRVRVHLDPSRPFVLDLDRAGQASTIALQLPSGLSQWRTGQPRPGLLAFRLFQVITLAFGLFVMVKRSTQPSALLGALLLASIATVSLVLPMRLAALWHALPTPAGLLLWIPFATSVAFGPLLFAFFAVFPRRRWSTAALAIALVPALVVVAWHVYVEHDIQQELGPPIILPDPLTAVFVMNLAYAVSAIGLLRVQRRGADTLTERRRIRVLGIGTVVGVTAGAAVIIGYWLHPEGDIFATRTLTVLSLVFLAVPASFAYAILRHRLFDVSLIVRQGLRYALARRFVDGLLPTLAVVLLVDIAIHRAEPIGGVLQARWWWFTLLGGTFFVVRSRREAWLESVDRRFFRERYDAQRLLGNIANQISRAMQFDVIAPSVMQQIEEALHPEFVAVLRHIPAKSVFEPVPSRSADDQPPTQLPASLAVIGVLAILRRPLALSLGDTAWVQHQLPVAERVLLARHRIELLAPICGARDDQRPAALLVLGPRRSEQPYNQEDHDLLATIAQALGELLERSDGERHALRVCESCGRCFDSGLELCTYDRQPLTVGSGSRQLKDRYRLDRRLGRGGMGTVYAAVDQLLERQVAVKLIREDITGPLDLEARFLMEAKAAAQFSHPHVVRVYDFGVDRERRPFLVMELLDGQTLRQRLAGGQRVSASEALEILRGVCSALSTAHAQGLVHRDLKPENIFLQRHANGLVPKVLDFGLAKAFREHRSIQQATVRHSSHGLLIGTVEYMAPEQVAGDRVDPSWDVWAMSIIAYEMITGRPRFRREAFDTDDVETGSGEPFGPTTGELSEALSTLFRMALSTDRALRPRGALDLLAACERALA